MVFLSMHIQTKLFLMDENTTELQLIIQVTGMIFNEGVMYFPYRGSLTTTGVRPPTEPVESALNRESHQLTILTDTE